MGKNLLLYLEREDRTEMLINSSFLSRTMKLHKNLHWKLILKKLKIVRNAFLLYVLVDTSYSFSTLFKFLRISVLKDELSKLRSFFNFFFDVKKR